MQLQKPVKLSILIPTYNEEDSLPNCIHELSEFINTQIHSVEVIFIDSGSSDNSLHIIKSAMNELPWLKLIEEGQRNGVGSAFKLGIKEAQGQLIAHYETDCPFDLENLNIAVDKLSLDTMKFIMGIRCGLRLNLLRKIYTTGYRWYIYLLFGLYLQTVNFGYKVYPTKLVKDHKFISAGWFFDAELLILAQENKLEIEELPVNHRVRVNGLSHVGLKDVAWIILEALQFMIKRKCENTTIGPCIEDQEPSEN